MSVKPILFNTEMVKAILDGRNTVTRRCVKPPKGIDDVFGHMNECKPPYQPGDILYVRETWRVGAWDIEKQSIAFDYADGTCRREWIHIADREKFDKYVQQSELDARKAGLDKPKWEVGKAPTRWRPSIHMPKEAARIWLKVTDVRVERLLRITEEQAIKEGFEPGSCQHEGAVWGQEDGDEWTAKTAFIALWDSTIPKKDLDTYGWYANPWVWVIEFERCEKPQEGVTHDNETEHS